MKKPLLFVFASVGILLGQCVRHQPVKSPRDMSSYEGGKSGVGSARRTEILFLGDNGHHKPIERVPQLMAALGNKGINITYTDKLEDLNAETLNKYDGLLIYANWDSIPKPQEKALLDYVASGKGVIPVHCASYCFRNSPEYVDKVVGGQFWRHKMDTIQTRYTQANSPLTAGLPLIKAYDETYLHSHLQADNNVLAVRDIKADQASDRPDAKEEPYTWTRQYGKGRVFYTAYGHDERTWSQPGFQQMLERGILWAVGDEVKKKHDALNPQPFAYHEAKLPNYEKRPGAQLQQEPLSPQESMKHLQVPVDFTLDLFAHEPNVMHPIALAWDERGRMYALITKDYPNERKPEGGSDVIVICEDTNKDGKADKFTNFAEGLSIPTGMVFANGGLYISQAPHMLFLQDTNGDDKADVKKVVFTGFGTFDTHAGPSNLHYGFDNWIWGSVGYAGFKGKIGADSVKFSQGFFRFKPDGSKLEHVTGTSNNTWGMAFNETGDVFGSTANNSHGWYMAIPNRYFHGGAHLRENGSRGTDTHKDMKPITERVRQVDVFGGFTAAAGHNFYTARAFPPAYWNKIAFVAEPTGHILHQNLMRKNGTDYEDTETTGIGFNLIAGADEWFAPVFAEVGPDGAVWVVDWYSYIIQHNPTPAGTTNGSGNAYETPLRDFTHGRIYRVGYSKAPAYSPLALSKDRPAELVAALKNDNMFWRMTAHRLLVERGNKDVIPQLLQLVNAPSTDKAGINPTAIHALRVIEGLNALNDPAVIPVMQAALGNTDAHVRKTVVQVLPRNQQSADALLKAAMLSDKEPLVVLNTLLAFSEMPQSPAIQQAILSRLAETNTASAGGNEVNDRWLPEAFACALAGQDGQLMKTYLKKVSANTPATPPAHDMNMHKPSKTGKGGPNPAELQSTRSGVYQEEPGMPVVKNEPTASPVATQPDLLIAAIRTTPESPAVREGTRIHIDVTNAGGEAIPAGTPIPLTVRIEGPNNVSDRAKIDFVSVAHTTGIKAGETVTISKGNNGPWSTDFNVNFDRAGQYTITVMLDRENKIAESNEQNNNKTQLLTYRSPQSMSAYVLERAIRSYTSVAPVDSVVALLRQAKTMDEAQRSAVVKGVAEGWDMKQKPTLREADKSFLASLTSSVSPDNRDRLNRLYEAWGLVKEQPADPNVEIVQLKTVREEMRFDKKEFTVTAGKSIEIVLANPDAMQHNLVIGRPKSMDIIGTAADKLITAKDGAEKGYVPTLPQIVAATPLVNPDQTYRLRFTAPAAPGDYPFVCTFPGHWRIMNGVMKVVKASTAVSAK
ncbi:PVC-type heme-binding CxxCH protein [Spirosoma utsteinense]|uniref:Membrane-bound dehydrogenase-like protein n=1 Tax=Spirosoma utsteinense TaxID=2585773 RepID=A0ABR6W1S8_9BACT|nr:PVC-type heme-binding CxxCH protein [Spirosoma utsteinense]MBC3785216.1 putative membrane-bound dehydrogenase-like protein [Spirosoma utsteinense]MBC3790559.1 putative membrane-bound dehydrogenase-like protein [Spirosoma utsteinense]